MQETHQSSVTVNATRACTYTKRDREKEKDRGPRKRARRERQGGWRGKGERERRFTDGKATTGHALTTLKVLILV